MTEHPAELVERVAKALSIADLDSAEKFAPTAWCELTEFVCEGYRDLARAALEAIRPAEDSLAALLNDAMDLIYEYHCQWGADYLAKKWDLPERWAVIQRRKAQLLGPVVVPEQGEKL